jgi:hypothetical protein
MSRHLIAFIDESFVQHPNHPGAYLLSAVVIDQDHLAEAFAAGRQAATRDGYHSRPLHQRGHITPIEDMLDVVEQHATSAMLTIQLPLGDEAHARQNALSRMLQELSKQQVRDMFLDTRATAEERIHASVEGRKIPLSNRPDVGTYRTLVRDGAISSRMRLNHITQHDQPGLWMADALAWAAHRALYFSEPQWWSRVTSVSTVIDAVTGTRLSLDPPAVPPSTATQRFHTLNGGTTHIGLGPSPLYQSVQQQITAGHAQVASAATLSRHIAVLHDQAAALARSVEATEAAPRIGAGPQTAAEHGLTDDPALPGPEPDIG